MTTHIVYYAAEGVFVETADVPGFRDAKVMSDSAAHMRLCMGLQLYYH